MTDRNDSHTREKIRVWSDENALSHTTRINHLRIPIFESIREQASKRFNDDDTDRYDTNDKHIWFVFTDTFTDYYPDRCTSVLLLTDEVIHVNNPAQIGVAIEVNGANSIVIGAEFNTTESSFQSPSSLAQTLLNSAQRCCLVDNVVARRDFASAELIETLNANGISHNIPPSLECIESREYRLAVQQFEFLSARIESFPAPPDEVSLRDALIAATEVSAYAFTTQQVRERYGIFVEPDSNDFFRFVQELRLHRRWPGEHSTKRY